jgi:DNA polymerase
MNWQNLERVAHDKDTGEQTHGFIRTAVEAPDGYVLVVGDSMNIESRVEDWLAGQDDQVEAYRRFDAGKGPDIYCVMAGMIFGRAINKKKDPDERFLGKTAKLGLGYGTGHVKFSITTKLPLKRSKEIVDIYRTSHREVVKLWRRCEEALFAIRDGRYGVAVDFRGIVTTCEDGLLLPNGLVIKYRDLKRDAEGEWSYWDGRARQKIYGAKVVENIVQALARIIVMAQTLMVPRRLVLSVHDEGVWLAREDQAEKVKAEADKALRTPLPWCLDLPLNCEVGYDKSYGKAKP